MYIICSLSDTYCFSHVHPLVSPVLCKRKLQIYSCLLHNGYMCIILLENSFSKIFLLEFWPFWIYNFGHILNIKINTSAQNLYNLYIHVDRRRKMCQIKNVVIKIKDKDLNFCKRYFMKLSFCIELFHVFNAYSDFQFV